MKPNPKTEIAAMQAPEQSNVVKRTKTYDPLKDSQNYLPIEVLSKKMRVAIEKGDCARHVNLITERDLQEAKSFLTEKQDMFLLSEIDTQMEDMIDAALEDVLELLEEPNTTACGLVVTAIRSMLLNHQSFWRYVKPTMRKYPRSAAAIRADMASDVPRSVLLLHYELEEALSVASEPSRRLRREQRRLPATASSTVPASVSTLPVDWHSRCNGHIEGGSSHKGLEGSLAIDVASLDDAVSNVEMLDELFCLQNPDPELHAALRSTVLYFLDAIKGPEAHVCEVVVGSLMRFMRNHPKLSGYADYGVAGPAGLPRRRPV